MRNIKLLRILAVAAAGLITCSVGFATTVEVNPANMGVNGWVFHITDPSVTYGAGDAVAEMVNGPATPPLGTGSAHFNTGSDGFQSAQLRNSSWAGTAIADLTSLSYSTYATAWNGQQLPFLNIYLSNGDRLWFEPDYTSPALLNTWQTWDTLSGKWYSNNHFGPGSNAKSWADILAAEGAGVTIVNNGAMGGIRIASGFASSTDVFDANVDAFTIGTAASTITYDFELTSSSVPDAGSTVALLGFALAGLAAFHRRKIAS